ncbi:uncharacterized protein LOC107828006 isoform X2 [Nicotiana tabacum]|nr:PREDICTED: uncharacterized protein LOC107828006 isoform X2 [Nicotiana tabacum]
MEGRKTNFTTVKGIRVDFSPQKMNKLPLVADRKTQAFIDQPKPHLDAIEDALYYFGADWGFETSGDKVILKVRNLKHRVRPLLKFLSHILTPNSNGTHVYLNQLALLHAICLKMPIDIGNIINRQLIACRYDTSVGTLWFPSIITKLLESVGIKSNPNSIVASEKMIDKKFWSNSHPTVGPRKKEGEEEEFLRKKRKQTLVSQSGIRQIMDLLARKFEPMEKQVNEIKKEVKEMKKEMSVKADGVKEDLKQMRHVQMQDIIYNSSMIYDNSSFLQRLAWFLHYNEFIQFSPLQFMDPSSCPIPKFYSSEELQATAQQLPPLPPIENQPPPPPPVPTPIISDHGSGNLSNLVDLATIFPGYTPLSIPNVGGSSMMEPNSQSEMVKSPRIGGGEFSENWIPVPVTQCGSSQPREENYFGGDDVGGTSRFIMRFNPGG